MRQPIHICIDARHIYPQIDGIGRYIFQLIQSMAEITRNANQFRFSILELQQFSHNSLLRSLDTYPHLTFVPLPHRPFTPGHLLTFLKVNALHPDVYHYTQFDLPPFISVPIVTTIHDMNPQMYSEHFEGRAARLKQIIARRQNKYALHQSDAVITISESTRNDLLRLYGIQHAAKVNTVYSGFGAELVRTEAVEGENRISELKTKYGFSRYFLYVGNNRPHKNLIKHLQAFKVLKSNGEYRDLSFVFIGKHYPDRFTNILQAASEMGLSECVFQFTVSDTELAALYKYAEAFVFCSLSEGFGFPVLEAMSFGTPVICSDISGTSEIAGSAAITVNPYDSVSISDGMRRIFRQDFNRAEFAMAGKKRCQEFTWEKTAEQTLGVYSDILKKRGKRR